MRSNIVLIGMPGAGKSTVGVILAKILGLDFLDSDLLIQSQEKRLLIDIIEQDGLESFIETENRINASIMAERTIIATGGSVIYGRAAMEHLREIAVVVYIRLSYHTLKRRLGNISQRGVALRNGQDLCGLYEERCPLYEKYAHVIIDGENKGVEEVLDAIEEKTKKEFTNYHFMV